MIHRINLAINNLRQQEGGPASSGHARDPPSRADTPPRAAAVIKDAPAREKRLATDEKILATLTTLSDRMKRI